VIIADWRPICALRHFPLIVAGAPKLRQQHFVIDGETVVLWPEGISDFDASASRRHGKRAQFYAFDMPAGASCFPAQPTMLTSIKIA
jgi:hypothetical protein